MPYQHQPYAAHPSAAVSFAHRLEGAVLLDQDAQFAAELAAATPVTPRPLNEDTTESVPMNGPEDDARGRVREPGEPTPEKPALKKPARSASEGARRDA